MLSTIRKRYFGFLSKHGRGLRGYIHHYVNFNRGGFDIWYFAILAALLVTGLLLMYSASYVNAYYDAGAITTGGNPHYYLLNQGKKLIAGFLIMMLVSHFKPALFRDFSTLAYIVAVILLVIVLVMPNDDGSDIKRWIEIPHFGQLQPSELAKAALIMFLAFCLDLHRKQFESSDFLVVFYFGFVAIIAGLIVLEKHLSCTILIALIGTIMIFLGGGRVRAIAAVLACGAVVAYLLSKTPLLADYQGDRIEIWLKLLRNEELSYDVLHDDAWQTVQSIYAIGSGGLWGRGIGQSRQKHLYLPEPQNDFVFGITLEEIGYIRGIIVMALYVALVVRGLMIARRTPDRYSQLLVMGISFQIGIQAVLNMAVVSGTVPNTGIGLPFFSFGGTLLLVLMAEAGMVLSVSRTIEKPSGRLESNDKA